MADGIIYGARSGIIRRIVSQTDLPSLQNHLGAGEALLIWSESGSGPPRLDQAIAAVNAHIGSIAPSSRCVVVDTTTGLVGSALMADPHIDEHPDGHVVQDDHASAGHVLLTNGSFVDPNVPVIDPNTGRQIGVAGIPHGTRVAGSFVPPITTFAPAPLDHTPAPAKPVVM